MSSSNSSIRRSPSSVSSDTYGQGQNAFVKCVVVGDGQVGKTCLLVRYDTDKFEDGYEPTIMDNYNKTVRYDDRVVRLLLFDTAGQEDYDRVRVLVYPHTDIFILCFSPFLSSSFENLELRWLPELRRACPNAPILLVATQADLRRRADMAQRLDHDGQPVISLEKGIRKAHEIGAVGYLECSALTGEGLNDVFDAAMEAVLNPRRRGNAEGSSGLLRLLCCGRKCK